MILLLVGCIFDALLAPGSHLVDRLMQEGHQVTVLDNFSSQQVSRYV